MMCDAMKELWKDDFDAAVKKEVEAKQESMKKEVEARQESMKNKCKTEGQHRVNNLNIRLTKAGRADEIIKAAMDTDYQKKLFEEFGV